MELVLLLLLGALRKRRARTFTPAQLEAIALERAQKDLQAGEAPALAAPQRPYRWWRYAGLC